MGCYINPRTYPAAPGAKERWLADHATPIEGTPDWSEPVDRMLLCWVDNGAFTATIVCYKQSEYEEVKADTGPRPSRWYSAPIEEIVKVSPLTSYLEREAARAAHG